ncbi:MAG TPA: response regulator [Verrucomicrobiae bacterium]|nr:response regulator [Verrucomicrobiae bacterium]
MNGAAKKILLVEDEPIAKSLYQNRLQSEGFVVSVAGEGDGALNELSKAQADLVVLDLTLPRMKGEEAVKQIRANDSLKAAPVLVISNAYMTEMSQKAMDSGATRGLLKTECTPGRLVETVRDLLGFRSAFDLSNSPVDDEKTIEEFSNAAERALADELKLKETREEFIRKAPSDIARIRENCRAYAKAGATTAAAEPLGQLYQLVRFFATRAGLSGCVPIGLVANAFEALLFDVLFKPSRATPSVSQTFAQAVDCLERLCQAKDGGVRDVVPRAKILVVDDEPVCNLAITAALKRAHFEPVAVEDSTKVVPMARSTQFDIIMLDINMPGVNGFDLCKNLRAMPQYKETPVIFITANADFQNRAQSILSGGNDLIPKPVSPLELVLKVTMRLLQPQGSSASKDMPAAGTRSSAPTPKEAAPAAPISIGVNVEPTETKPLAVEPPLSVAARQASFSTEMLKKAWSAERIETPATTGKLPETNAANGVEMHQPEGKVELPTNETGTKAPSGEESMKLDVEAVSVGPLKMAEAEKPRHVNGADKSDELKESKIELTKIELPATEHKSELSKVDFPEVEPAKAVEPTTEQPKVEEPKVELPKIEDPAPAPVQAQAEEPQAAPTPIPQPKLQPEPLPLAAQEEKPAEIVAAETSLSPETKPQQTNPTMDNNKKPTLDEAARGVARIIFGDENLNDMNVRLTRIALEKYNVPGTQKLDDVARGVSQIIFGDDKVSDMNVRLTRIALERYNVADVLHLNGSNGAKVAA